MSVLSLTYDQPGTELELTGDAENPKREISIPIQVRTSSILDQADTIASALRDNPQWPYPGRFYQIGNEVNQGLLCSGVSCSPEPGKPTMWRLKAKYAPAGDDKNNDQQKPDENGKLTSDPEKWLPEIEINTAGQSRTVEKANYLKGYVGTAQGLLNGKKGIRPCNSAFMPFNPPLEQQWSLITFRASRYYKRYSMSDALIYKDSINESDVVVDNKLIYVACYKHWGLVTHYGGVLTSMNVGNQIRFFWKVSVEISINPESWDPYICDMGVDARAIAGDPDGRGGTISASDLPAGAIEHRRLTDPDGIPVSDPVLFNGDGQPLKPPTGDPVYGQWQIYRKEVDLTDLFNLKLVRG
jgi:hypothetical protein